jgi:hypothetical protein
MQKDGFLQHTSLGGTCHPWSPRLAALRLRGSYGFDSSNRLLPCCIPNLLFVGKKATQRKIQSSDTLQKKSSARVGGKNSNVFATNDEQIMWNLKYRMFWQKVKGGVASQKHCRFMQEEELSSRTG